MGKIVFMLLLQKGTLTKNGPRKYTFVLVRKNGLLQDGPKEWTF